MTNSPTPASDDAVPFDVRELAEAITTRCRRRMTPGPFTIFEVEEIAVETVMADRRARPHPTSAEAVVDAIFADLRGRSFLKWLFDANPDRAGPVLHEQDGAPLHALSAEAQADIRAAWITILRTPRVTGVA